MWWCCLNDRNLFCYCLEPGSPKIKMSAGLVSSGGFFPGLAETSSGASSYSLGVFLCVHVFIFSCFKDASHIGLEPTLMYLI